MGQNNFGLSAYNKGAPKIKTLTIRHKSIARAMVAGGLEPKDIATLYGMSSAQLSVIIGSAAFKAEVARLEAGADEIALNCKEELFELRPIALANIEEDLGITPTTERLREIRQKASLSILDRTNLGSTDKKDSSFGGNITNIQNILNIKNASKDELREAVFDMISYEQED